MKFGTKVDNFMRTLNLSLKFFSTLALPSIKWSLFSWYQVKVSKKTEKLIKPKKPEKNNWKNRTVKKPIKILKKPASLVRFWFYKQKTKPSQTEKNEPNRAKPKKPVFVLKNQTKPNRNRLVWPVLVFLK